ncbi:DUF2970 domain-containing protein [Arhodomonas sp. SL1]|uniref:DUF2970 domain-containing protein n=1 Tax=Arhodomonas sp. SL1 TaxID=3425691 RepID=UPI003F880317
MERDDARQQDRQRGEGERPPSFLQVMKSVAAAAFGVQSEEARQRDFSHGRAGPFIIAGIIFTAAFVIVLVVIVNLVLSSAGV